MNNPNNILPVIAINRLRMSTDGQGIRTLIGVYNCPLRCKYCINKSSWDNSIKPTIYSKEELFQRVSVDNIYFQATNGGLTIGGGEPLLYSSFIKEFAELCPDEWSIYVETSLNVPWENIIEIKDVVNHFIIDIKTLDEEAYRHYTGGNIEPVIKNLQKLISEIGFSRITVRVPLIEDFVDYDMQNKSIEKLQRMGISNIDSFRYKIIR